MQSYPYLQCCESKIRLVVCYFRFDLWRNINKLSTHALDPKKWSALQGRKKNLSVKAKYPEDLRCSMLPGKRVVFSISLNKLHTSCTLMKAHNFRTAQNNLTVLYALLMPKVFVDVSPFYRSIHKDAYKQLCNWTSSKQSKDCTAKNMIVLLFYLSRGHDIQGIA